VGDDGGVHGPGDLGDADAPPVESHPYAVVFEAAGCIGAGKCAEVSPNWTLDLDTGLARPRAYYVAEADLAHNVRAAEVCPAKKGRGVIHVIDRRTGEEVAPDPEGDGTPSVDW
jgi:ferredoxin